MEPLKAEIVEAIARTLHVMAYAQHVEDGEYNEGNGGPCEGCKLFRGHAKGHPKPGPGEDWDDYAPKTSKEAREEALILVGATQQANDCGILSILAYAAKWDGMDPYADNFEYPKLYAASFGSDLAMMALGTGVSWFDSHKEFDLKVPSVEFHYF